MSRDDDVALVSVSCPGGCGIVAGDRAVVV
jgi:hypothetical protein